MGARPGAGGFIAPAYTFGWVAGALNPPRPAGQGWGCVLTHAGMLSGEADACSDAAILLQELSAETHN